jgi:hypothetical protein
MLINKTAKDSRRMLEGFELWSSNMVLLAIPASKLILASVIKTYN